jgi:hypothetical protein
MERAEEIARIQEESATGTDPDTDGEGPRALNPPDEETESEAADAA